MATITTTAKQKKMLAKLDDLAYKHIKEIAKVVEGDEQLSYWMHHNLIYLIRRDIAERKEQWQR